MSTPLETPVRELVLASAGSGKTYRISSRIIELLAGGVEPSSILASTFTRKAAGEILQRVMLRLARAADDADEARRLAEDTLHGDHVAVGDPEYWSRLLKRTVRELHRFNISTLDAYFVRVARCLAHDLGLPSHWGIADRPTEERIRAEALDRVLESDPQRLLGLIRALHAGAARRSVHEAVARDIDGIMAVHRAIMPGSPGWEAMRMVAGPAPESLAERARALAGTLVHAPIPLTKGRAPKPNKRWSDAVQKLITALCELNWEAIVEGGLGGKVIECEVPSDARYYGDEFPSELLELTREALALAGSGIAHALAASAESMGALAASYDEAFRAGLFTTGSLRFEDVTRVLLDARALGRRGALGYRLDSLAEHLLLDEFQDTSVTQWRALRPLTDALMTSAGSAAIVVADPKQSIYGWRGAAPVVVDTLGERYNLPTAAMTKSWRSSQVVLDAVNRVFGAIGAGSSLFEKDAEKQAVSAWCRAFRPHVAARVDLPGHARMMAGPALTGTTQRQPVFTRFAARYIADLHDANPGRTIGVLTRNNDEVALLIFELGRLGVPASEEGGTRLLDSPAVVSLLALLRFVDHPGDGLSRYHAAMTPVASVVGLTSWDDAATAGRVAGRVRRRLMEDGYGRTLADLVFRLGDALGERDRIRARRLVEIGYAWDASRAGSGLRVDDFVRVAETARAESPGDDTVRVMTVHGSKGLEFDLVVLPQLHTALTGRPDTSPLGYDPDGTGVVTHAFPYVKDKVAPLFSATSELVQAVNRRKADRLRDALGVLYVAMTRARYALHLLVPSDEAGRKSTAQTFAQVLRATLREPTSNDPVVEGELLFESGRPDWTTLLPAPVAVRPGKTAAVPHGFRLRVDGQRSRGLDRTSPSAPGADESVDVESLLGIGGSHRARDRGSVVHAWLQTLEWLEDGMGQEESLLATAARVTPDWTDEERRDLLAWLRTRLEMPEIATALSRSSWPPGTRVERELPFLSRDGDVLVEGIIDRLLLIPDPDGGIAEAVVIDYKTDRLDRDDASWSTRMRHYTHQIRTYQRATGRQYGLAPARVRGLLLFLHGGVEHVATD